MYQLTELEQDAITEILNIGMGTAAAALSQMVNEEISLSVPSVDLLDIRSAKEYITEKLGKEISAIEESFSGPISGHALLIFPEKQSLELVRIIINEDIGNELLTEMEQEAMIEIGNIILNSCVSCVANFLGEEVQTNIPTFLQGQIESVISTIVDDSALIASESNAILLLKTEFSVNTKNIRGYVSFIMNMPSVDNLRMSIQKYIDQPEAI